MDSQIWSLSLLLCLSLSGVTIASNPTNHVNGHDTVDSSGPMLQPGRPLVTPPAQATVARPKITISPTTTPPKPTTTANSTAVSVSVTRRLTLMPTVGNTSRTLSPTQSSVNASITPAKVTGTVSSTDNATIMATGTYGEGTTENSTAPANATDNSTVVTSDMPSTIPVSSPILHTGMSNDSTTSIGSTGTSTNITISNSTTALDTTLVDATDVPSSLVSTDNGTLMATTLLDQGTTVEVNTSPAELSSTDASSNRTTRAAEKTTPAGLPGLTTGSRTTDLSTSDILTTTDFSSTTSHVPAQTSRPTPLTSRRTNTPTTTTHAGIPNKNKTTPTPPPVATTPRKTSPPSLTTPWHWPFPTTTQEVTQETTLMTSLPVAQPTSHDRTTHRQRPIRTTLHPVPVPTTIPPAFNSSYKLPTYLQLRLETTWPRFCVGQSEVQEALVAYAQRVLRLSSNDKLVAPYLNVRDYCRETTKVNRLKRNAVQQMMTPVDFFVGISGAYYENLTRKVGAELLLDSTVLQEDIKYQIISTHILAVSTPTTPTPTDNESQGAVIGSTLSVCALVFGVVLALVGMRVYRVRKAHAGLSDRYYFDGKQLQDALSESNQRTGVSLHGRAAGGRSHPAPTYREYILASFNKGMVLDDEETMVELDAVEALPSHTLTSSALAKFYSYREAITEEFENLPGHHLLVNDAKKKMGVPLSSKLRSAVGHSPQRTKVPIPPLSPTSPESPSKGNDFVLDASFIRGYGSSHCRYIGAKVSGVDSSTAFWRTIWEQQSRTIVCLCSPYELGKICPQYWPTKEGGPGTQLYGNILVTLKGGASGEHYFTSSLLIRNVEKSLCRPVTHYWFTNWRDGEVPSSSQALMSMLLQVHNKHQESYGPVIVHCSDGIGRTGLVIATDINMQRLEEDHTIDIPHTVSSIRQDRGQAILNVEQYAFIYKTLFEFSKFLNSSVTKETSDTESVAHENLDDSISDIANDDGSSQGTNSSRTSSYLGDLSASVKRTLALKFPSLGLRIPSIHLSPPSSRVSTGNFVVFNSPQATNLDMSVVSGISESDNGERNSDQTSSCNQSDMFVISHNDSTRLVPKGSSRHFSISQIPSKKESCKVTPRPLSTFCRGSKAMSHCEVSKDYEDWSPEHGQPEQLNLQQSLSSPKTDLRVKELSSGSRKRSGTNESLASTNPFKFEEPHQEAEADQAPAPESYHVRQTSYPVDMNPFGAPSPALPRSETQFTPFSTPSPVSPTSLYNTPDIHQNQTYNSNPFPIELSSSSFENSYPREINPFEDVCGANDVFDRSSDHCTSSNNAYVYVPRPDTAEHFIRQGTYPKGMNPFNDSGGHQHVPPHLSQSARGRNGLQLGPVTNRQINGPPPEEYGSYHGMNPFDHDWMDSAEESFT